MIEFDVKVADEWKGASSRSVSLIVELGGRLPSVTNWTFLHHNQCPSHSHELTLPAKLHATCLNISLRLSEHDEC